MIPGRPVPRARPHRAGAARGRTALPSGACLPDGSFPSGPRIRCGPRRQRPPAAVELVEVHPIFANIRAASDRLPVRIRAPSVWDPSTRGPRRSGSGGPGLPAGAAGPRPLPVRGGVGSPVRAVRRGTESGVTSAQPAGRGGTHRPGPAAS